MTAVGCALLLGMASPAIAEHGDIHPPGEPERTFELVSPPYKVSGAGVGIPPSNPGDWVAPYRVRAQAEGAGTAAYVGERFAVSSQLGGTMLDSPFATANDWAFSERVSDGVGWRSHSPVTHPFRCSEDYRMQQMQQASPDFSTVVWSTNGGDLPFFEPMCTLAMSVSNRGHSLVSDWGSPPESPTKWEPIGPLEPAQRVNGSDTWIFKAPGVSADGGHLAVSGAVRGLAGPGDPTVDTVGTAAHSAYVDDLSAGLSDSWPGAGVRVPAAACTGGGAGMQARTAIPARNVDGSLGEVACAGPAAGRDSRLVSSYGSSVTRQPENQLDVGTSNTNVISGDGSRVFFMAPDPGLSASNTGAGACTADTGLDTKCPAQLYVRQRNVDGEVVTRWVSRPEASFGGAGQAALLGRTFFEGASADGSRVFFRTASPLTADDPNGTNQVPANPNPQLERGETSWDLYMFELAPGPDGDPSTPDGDPTGSGSELTRITAGPDGSSDCSTQPTSDNAAALRFFSQDASRVYFACAAPLDIGADTVVGSDDDPWNVGPAGGVTAPAGTPTTGDQVNVYLYDSNQPNLADRYRFVARIPSGGTDPLRCASTAALRGTAMHANGGNKVNCWRGTDDGSFATFWTAGDLVGESGVDPSYDIYGYDADSHELERISAPRSSVDETYMCATVVCYADQGLASGSAFISVGNPLLGVVSDPPAGLDRVVYFESASRLVEDDHNGEFDVYRWADGVLSLVSSGAADSKGSAFKGNSADGQNVYIATDDRLSWQDIDLVMDVYTARVDGGVPEPVQPVVCGVLAGGCHGAGTGSLSAPVLGGRGGDVSPGVRRRLAVGGLSAAQRRRAARSGVVRLRVRANAAGRVTAVARGRVKRRAVVVGRASKRLARPGTVVLAIRLTKPARSRLRAERPLGLSVRVSLAGAVSRSLSVTLRRAGK